MQYKTTTSKGLSSEAARHQKLLTQQDPLLRLQSRIDFEQFRPLLESSLHKPKKGKGGARPYDYVLMFKILILQRYYNLSDDALEFNISDRYSFRRFLGLCFSDKVPDAKTVWHYREQLTKASVIQPLFEQFQHELNKYGLIGKEGKLVDASFVDVPKQRNSRDENKQVKAGEVPTGWEDNPHKLVQKDLDARWTKKNGQSYYGYKNHIKADAKSKLIDSYVVTDASVHDSQALELLLTDKDAAQPLYADSAYTGENQEASISKVGMTNQVHEKGYRNNPLTDSQKEQNTLKSKTRARVEHIFGFIENSMNRSYIRTIGMQRASTAIGLMNITYNMFRAMQLGYIAS